MQLGAALAFVAGIAIIALMRMRPIGGALPVMENGAS